MPLSDHRTNVQALVTLLPVLPDVVCSLIEQYSWPNCALHRQHSDLHHCGGCATVMCAEHWVQGLTCERDVSQLDGLWCVGCEDVRRFLGACPRCDCPLCESCWYDHLVARRCSRQFISPPPSLLVRPRQAGPSHDTILSS
jgi:hypothetical protein